MKRVLFFLIVLVVITLSLVTTLHLGAIKIVYTCKIFTIDNACIIKKVNEAIDINPNKGAVLLTEFASLRRMSLLGGDFRAYSSYLHYLGHMFYMNKYAFNKIGEVCPALIKDGCIHGYVMEYINTNDMSKGVELCNTATNNRVRLACVHALGHSYLELNNQPVEQASKSFCKNYSDLEYNACMSGLFHENSKFGEGMGHEHYYQRSHTFNNISCDNFTGEDYTICYGTQGSFRQYFPESESIKVTYKICDEAKTEEAKKSCRYNASQRLDIARGYSFVNL